jgi:hypothetical protein
MGFVDILDKFVPDGKASNYVSILPKSPENYCPDLKG